MQPPSGRPKLAHAVGVLAVALVSCWAATAHAVNYVPNPGFESCGVSPTAWSPVAAESVSCEEASPNTGSFSIRFSNAASTSLARVQSDCVVVPPSTFIQTFRFAYRTASSAVLQVALTANAYTGSDCTGSNAIASAGAGSSFLTPIATDGAWHILPSVTALIDGSMHSVRFVASFQVDSVSATGVVDFDDLEFADASSTTSMPPSSSTSTTGTTTSTTVVTVTSTTVATPTTLPSFPGTGPAASECYVTLQGIAPGANGRLDCADGDAACDADGAANGRCTFSVHVCVAQTLPGCQAGTVTAVKVTPTKFAIPVPSVPATAAACGDSGQIVVPLRRAGRAAGRVRITLVAKSNDKPKRDRDVVRLRCLPSG